MRGLGGERGRAGGRTGGREGWEREGVREGMEDASLPLKNNQACFDAIYQAKTSLLGKLDSDL